MKMIWFRSWLFLAVTCLVASLLLFGCAVGETPGSVGCTTDDDCEFGKSCQQATGVCESVRVEPGPPTNPNSPIVEPDVGAVELDTSTQLPPDDTGTQEPDTAAQPDVGSSDIGTPDMGIPDTGTPDVDAPDSGAPDTGAPDTGPDPTNTCQANGDLCDLANRFQGEYTCMLAVSGVGRCYRTCTYAWTADNCDSGRYCRDYGSANEPAPICVPRECNTHAECGAGKSCVKYNNNYSMCIDAGARTEGQSCNVDASPVQCGAGLWCARNYLGTSAGVCRRMCNPWGGSNACPNYYQACRPVWPETGVCSHDIDYTIFDNRRSPFGACYYEEAMCDHAVECNDMGSYGMCLKSCRPGGNDCSGVRFDGVQTVCDHYWTMGETSIGTCWRPCSGTSCGAGWTCKDQICRRPCPTGNILTECCGGDTSCSAICRAGLCE